MPGHMDPSCARETATCPGATLCDSLVAGVTCHVLACGQTRVLSGAVSVPPSAHFLVRRLADPPGGPELAVRPGHAPSRPRSASPCVCVCMHVPVCMRVRVCVCACVCMHVCPRMYVHAHRAQAQNGTSKGTHLIADPERLWGSWRPCPWKTGHSVLSAHTGQASSEWRPHAPHWGSACDSAHAGDSRGSRGSDV